MKKRLFLLPLVAFALCGCGEDPSPTPSPTPTPTPTPTPVPTPSGDLIGSVTMSKCQDMGDPGVFTKGDVTVTVTQNTCRQTIDDAVKATGNYEFRVYAYMKIEFSAEVEFSQIKINYSNYVDKEGKTFYFDYEEMEGATNQFDNDKCIAVVTLDEPAYSYEFVCWHQTRIASVSLYAE